MPNESNLWGDHLKLCLDELDAHYQRHEDKTALGVPDVSYAVHGFDGWIELKYLPSWPVRPVTPVRIDHYTNEQRRWLYDRWLVGNGKVFVLLQIEKDFLIFSGAPMLLVGRKNKQWLYDNCLNSWKKHINTISLKRVLSK